MKIFLSHSSSNKSNVKSIVSYLPKQYKTWLDENNLIWGSDLENTFESVIKTEIDYLLVFISKRKSDNPWVVKEINWALEKQKELGRIFLLPIIMPELKDVCEQEYPELTSKKVVFLDGYEEINFKSCAEKIASNILSLIIEDVDNLHHPKEVKFSQSLSEANSFIQKFISSAYKIIFKHRENNPIKLNDLYTQINTIYPNQFQIEYFQSFIDEVFPLFGSGIYYDGDVMYLEEEHSLLKSNYENTEKKAIAKLAMSFIRPNQTIFIDAGSTMNFLIELICKRIKSKNIRRMNLILISTEHINAITNVCSNMGMDGQDIPIKVIVPHGFVRPNTKAIVCEEGYDLNFYFDLINKIDVAFIGANGIDSNGVVYTHQNDELHTKLFMKNNATKTFLAFDDTKCGIKLEAILADLNNEDRVEIIINNNKNNSMLNDLNEKFKNKIHLANIE